MLSYRLKSERSEKYFPNASALLPAAAFDVLEFDLGRSFDITQSGSYELWVTCAQGGAAKSKPETSAHDYFSFLIADPLPQDKQR